jgi:hypothetical protein
MLGQLQAVGIPVVTQRWAASRQLKKVYRKKSQNQTALNQK